MRPNRVIDGSSNERLISIDVDGQVGGGGEAVHIWTKPH